MLHPEVLYLLNRRVYLQIRKSVRLQLVNPLQMRNMVAIDMHISHHMHELPSF